MSTAGGQPRPFGAPAPTPRQDPGGAQRLDLPTDDRRWDSGFVPGTHYELVPVARAGMTVRRFTDSGREALALNLSAQGPPTGWPSPLRGFILEHRIPSAALPKPGAWGFLIPALLAGHWEYAWHRTDLEAVRVALSAWYKAHPEHKPRPTHKSLDASGDAIQAVNKTGQWGLQHQTLSGPDLNDTHYRLARPFTYDPSARRLRDSRHIAPGDRGAGVALVKDYVRANFIDVPDEEWEQGHRRPDDDESVIWQPGRYQGSRRNRFLFDEMGLVLCPTIDELLASPAKYYTRAELTRLVDALSDALGLRSE